MFIASIFRIDFALINHVFNLFRAFVTSLDSMIVGNNFTPVPSFSDSRFLLEEEVLSFVAITSSDTCSYPFLTFC